MSALRDFTHDYVQKMAASPASSAQVNAADGGGSCQPDIPDEPTPQVPPDWRPETVTRVYVQKGLCPPQSEYVRCIGEEERDFGEATTEYGQCVAKGWFSVFEAIHKGWNIFKWAASAGGELV